MHAKSTVRVFALAAGFGASVAGAQTTAYVDQNAPDPRHDGSSWYAAVTDVQDRFDLAGSGAPNRGADSAYTPDRGTGDRTVTFQLVDGVTLEGGFCDKGNDTCATAVVIDSLPYANTGNTEGCMNDYDEVCPYSGSTSPDVVYSYTPTEDVLVDIDLCTDGGATNYDTKLYVYEDACPGTLIACNDDDCPSYNIPYVSQVERVRMLAGHRYYIVVDGYGGEAGDYELQVDLAGPCAVDCDPDMIDEGELPCFSNYVDPYNGGCDSTVPAFLSIACGDRICGESGVYDYFGSTRRDTDWYEFTLYVPETVEWTVEAEFDVLIFIIDSGSGDCADYTILDSATARACQPVTLTYPVGPIVGCNKTIWLWVGPSSLDPLPCGSKYIAAMGSCSGSSLPEGACCVDGGCTLEVSEACCDEAGGVYRGDGTVCEGPPDCNGNGVHDACDLIGDDCNGNGVPDDCDCGNGVVDTCAGEECDPPGDECCDTACHYAPAGTVCGNPAGGECDDQDICNGAGNCDDNYQPAGTKTPPGSTCDDGHDCTNDECDGAGGCQNPNEPAGTPCGDPSDSDCDNPDLCDGVGGCQGNNEPEGTPCTDDGDSCTDDVCSVDTACTHPRWLDDDPRACGACCFSTAGKCYDDRLDEECRGDVWAVNDSCANRTITCEKVIIPTVSEWGVVFLSLFLSVGIAVRFGRRRRQSAA